MQFYLIFYDTNNEYLTIIKNDNNWNIIKNLEGDFTISLHNSYKDAENKDKEKILNNELKKLTINFNNIKFK